MKKKKEKPEFTQEEIEKLCEEAGFILIAKPKVQVFGKSDDKLHRGDTIIYPEGSKKGYVIKSNVD